MPHLKYLSEIKVVFFFFRICNFIVYISCSLALLHLEIFLDADILTSELKMPVDFQFNS